MRTSAFAPAAILLGLFTLPAQAADLSALTNLATQLGGGSTTQTTGSCNPKQVQDLQKQIYAAKVKGDTVKANGLQMAVDHITASCSGVASSQQPINNTAAPQDPKAQAIDAGIKALGGLFK
ncbi:Protein of unknown function (DUF1090) [Pseudomonas asplenii]|uniref:DUF1090 domain-containing protein n=1 Tax=Pseudomonas asplenii TaxID=53407 RepID=A0A0N0E2X4_9PSED|nr:DUF1090 family protein [Pseudomonas fuscovaginae]KPA89420.1 Protein of unknown function (DUF1090) [Pseudomonas fuscovaginae]